MVSSHTDHYQLWHDAHRENHMQWVELKGIKDRLVWMDEQMAALHLKEEEIGAQNGRPFSKGEGIGFPSSGN